jgi:methylmalonyl-CoA/ethylmalonyl-CoA epimerase
MASLGASHHTSIVEDPIQRVKVVFLCPAVPGQPQVELVEPVGDKSPVRRFLDCGGGLHHVCYQVDDLAQQLAHMQTLGAALVRRPMPAAAFDNRRIAWVLTPQRLLIEYLERAR